MKRRAQTLEGEALLRAVDLLNQQLTVKGRTAFLRMIRNVTNKPGWHRLVRLIHSGHGLDESVQQEIENLALTSDVLQAIWQQAYTHGGKTAARIYTGFRSGFSTDARTLRLAREASAFRIAGIAESTREAFRGYIADSLAAGMSPAELALTLKPHLGLTLQQTRLVAQMRNGLKAKGMSAGRANRRAADYAQTLLRQRAETIAETESVWATEAGKRQFYNDAVNAGLLSPNAKLVWTIEDDDRVDDLCISLAGTEISLNDQGFATSVGMVEHPPIHPRCRCQLILSGTQRVPVLQPGRSPLGPIASPEVVSHLVGDKGFTMVVPTGVKPTDGWLVALPGHESRIPLSMVTRDWISQYRRAHAAALMQEGSYWGGWVETDVEGRMWAFLDVSQRFKPSQKLLALRRGQDWGQLAIYNIGTGKTVRVPKKLIDLRRVQGQTKNRFTNLLTGERMSLTAVGDTYEQALMESEGHRILGEYFGGTVTQVARGTGTRTTPVDFEILLPGGDSMATEFKTLNINTPNMKTAIKRPEWIRKWAYAIDTPEARTIVAAMKDTDKESVEAAYQAIKALEAEQGLKKTPLLVANVIDDTKVLVDDSGRRYIIGKLYAYVGDYPSRNVYGYTPVGEYRIYMDEWERSFGLVTKAVDYWGVEIEAGDWVIELIDGVPTISPVNDAVFIPLDVSMSSDSVFDAFTEVIEKLSMK